MRKKYLGRHQRARNPEPVKLQERDLAALAAVHKHRVLSQDQLHRLVFAPSGAGPQVTKRRLRKLYDNKLLERKHIPVDYGEGSSPVLYVLDREGARQLGVTWYHTSRDLSPYFLAHATAVNEFIVTVMQACQAPGYAFVEWLSDQELKADFDRVEIESAGGRKVKKSVIPDAYFVIATPTGSQPYFLELDRGTTGTRRFKEKVNAYNMYLRRGKSRTNEGEYIYQDNIASRRFGANAIRVLTVVDTWFKVGQKRITNLMNASANQLNLSATQRRERMSEQSGVIPVPERFLFTTLPEVDAATVLQGKIWRGLTTRERRSLT